jgi:hypothetical protein
LKDNKGEMMKDKFFALFVALLVALRLCGVAHYHVAHYHQVRENRAAKRSVQHFFSVCCEAEFIRYFVWHFIWYFAICVNTATFATQRLQFTYSLRLFFTPCFLLFKV